MKPIAEASSHLDWTHPEPPSHAYDLRDGDDVVASLAMSEGIERADARSAGFHWTFRKFGYEKPHVIVLVAGSDKDHARFDTGDEGPGQLKFDDGRQFRWNANLWRGEWNWTDTAGDQVVAFKRDFDVTERHEGTVEIKDKGRDSAHLGALALLGWYLIIVAAETSGAAG